MFIGYGALVLGTIALRRATGLDMARYTGDWRSGWIDVAIATFLVMAPIGPLVINPRLHAVARAASGEAVGEVPGQLENLLRDSVLTIALRASLAVLVGLV